MSVLAVAKRTGVTAMSTGEVSLLRCALYCARALGSARLRCRLNVGAGRLASALPRSSFALLPPCVRSGVAGLAHMVTDVRALRCVPCAQLQPFISAASSAPSASDCFGVGAIVGTTRRIKDIGRLHLEPKACDGKWKQVRVAGESCTILMLALL